MWVFLPTSHVAASGPSQRFFSCVLLCSILVSVVAIPFPYDTDLQLRDTSASNVAVPDVPYQTPSLEKDSYHIAPRQNTRKPKKVTKPKTPTTPQTPKKTLEPWQGPVPAESTIYKQCKVPKDKVLFWSGTWAKVESYAKQERLVTDEDAFPPGYTLRFAGRDERKAQIFANRFSRVFARKASGVVYVMVPWAGGPNPSRVFHKHQWPILKKSFKRGKVTRIIQVNPDNWNEVREYDPKVYGLTRRDTAIDLNNVPRDVNLDDLAEAWKRENHE